MTNKDIVLAAPKQAFSIARPAVNFVPPRASHNANPIPVPHTAK